MDTSSGNDSPQSIENSSLKPKEDASLEGPKEMSESSSQDESTEPSSESLRKDESVESPSGPVSAESGGEPSATDLDSTPPFSNESSNELDDLSDARVKSSSEVPKVPNDNPNGSSDDLPKLLVGSARKPIWGTPPKPRQRAAWLGKLGLICFAIGATTSTVLALIPRVSLTSTPPLWGARFSFSPRAEARAAQPLSSLGATAQAVSRRGLGAFPGEVSASFLCLPSTEPTSGLAASSQSVAKGPIQSSLGNLQSGVDPSFLNSMKATPWPNIHEAARLARVPVLMYHDILEEKEVFFDVTVEEFEDHLARIEEEGLTPISFDQLYEHLLRGAPLPPKPVLLTFDDGYEGHYTHVYPLLKEYQYPAVFSLFTGKMDGDVAGRSTVTWEHAKEMAADPLITIASHSIMHPRDLRELDDAALRREVFESKARLESQLGIPIRYFTYPEGNYDERVAAVVAEAGYDAALTMSNYEEWYAGESDDLLSIGRFGQSQLETVIPEAWEGLATPIVGSSTFDFYSPVRVMEQLETEEVPLALVMGGRPVTVHADSRYQLEEILARTNAKAAVDGAFFSLEYLDSNVMIGPVLSQATQTFIPGNPSENPLLNGRPLALISPDEVKFVPFDADKHNTLHGVQAEMSDVTDAFVGAAWLVRDGQPQTPEAFGSLFDFEAYRHRAFWGINRAGQPVIGITKGRIDSVGLGELLHRVGFRDAIMVDSGASTSLTYDGEPLADYVPRPVPHMIALLTEEEATGTCPLRFEALEDAEETW